jgi:penicillin amidase
MRILKIAVVAIFTIAWCYFLANRWVIQGSPVPPLGKFLDPFQGFWENAENESFPYETDLVLPQLTTPVTVSYDAYGIPHIFAENLPDLFRAQGYIMAQHRLWQMEFQTHAAAGRVSEIIGEGAINFDRMQRRKGMLLGAHQSFDTLMKDPEMAEYLNAYSEGANAYIQSLDYADLPVEYKLLGYSPEAWTPFKTALILQYMIDELTGYDEDLENSNTLAWLGEEQFNFLFPERPAGVQPVVPTGSDNGWKFDKLTLPSDSITFAPVLTETVMPKPDPDNGSNNWAVSGKKTASGDPILANDTHLGLNLPSLWMLMHLKAPEYNVLGFTFAGQPGITIGFNESNAWAFTNGPRDHRDWYRIRFIDEANTQYAYDGSISEVTTGIEEIKVRGGETFYDTIRYSHHGPIVYDESFGDQNARKHYALRWIGHDKSEVLRTIILLNKSENYEDYKEAIRYWDAPPQNIIFASRHGDIAIWNQGQFPLKQPGQGKFLMEGDNPANEWNTFIPKDQNPFQHNPERGYVSSANQHSVDEKYPYWTYDASYEYHRNRIINNQLDTMKRITVKDMMDLHSQPLGMKAFELLPLFLERLDSTATYTERAEEVIASLRAWDYMYDVNQTAPVYFDLWYKNFYRLLWDEFYAQTVPVASPTSYYTTLFLKENREHPFVDNQSIAGTQTLGDLVNIALDSALVDYDTWAEKNENEDTWGYYKGTFVRHLADVNGSLAPFSRYNVMVSGESDAINSVKRNHGPSQRMVVQLSNPPQAWGIYPGGQSGNPGSPLYDNMIDMWRDGEYIPLVLMKKSDPSEFTQTLTPGE